MRVLLTGASGFVGRALVDRLAATPDVELRAAARRPAELPDGIATVRSPELGADADWREALAGIEVVIHAAARVHVMQDTAVDPLAAFRAANVDGTLALARQAVAAGVRRFVFISSIGVNGIASNRPFTEDDPPEPIEPYSISKLEAERALASLSHDSGMELVVIRPPLVYGPSAPGNFGKLMSALARGVLLPLGAIEHNRRTFVALDNLVDLIVVCIEHPAAANQVFLAGDREDMSTTELLRRLAAAMGVRPRLVSVPLWALRFGGTVLGKQAMIQRLCGSLQVDTSKARNVLGWRPPVGVTEGLRRAAQDFLQRGGVREL